MFSPSFLRTGCACLLALLALVAGGRVNAAPERVQVEMLGANEHDGDHGAVLSALEKLLQGLAHRDLEQIGSCLDADVTVMDDRSHKFVCGKQAVLDHIQKNVIGSTDSAPVKKIVVRYPFVRVKGDMAMVSFRATKEMTDPKSPRLESWCSEVFERKGGEWLVLNFQSSWKPARVTD